MRIKRWECLIRKVGVSGKKEGSIRSGRLECLVRKVKVSGYEGGSVRICRWADFRIEW